MEPTSSVPSLRRKLLFAAILASVSLAVTLVVGEIIVRTVAPVTFNNHLRIYDPHLGWRARPGMLLYRSLDRPVRFAANRLGFRDREHNSIQTVSRRSGARKIRKIMIFGDSFTEAAQVEIYETFWSILKHRLNSREDDVYWEVQVFAVGDWGTTQQWLAYRKYGRLADLAILQVFPLNDIVNNSISAANIASSQDAFRPYLDPETGYDKITYLNPKTSWLRQRSSLARFLIQLAITKRGAWGREESYRNAKERIADSNRKAQALGLAAEFEYPAILYNTFSFKDEQFGPIDEGWQATDRAILRFANAAKKRKDKAMVVVVPHIGQLQPVAKSLEELPFSVHTDYAEKRITSLLADRDVSVVGMLDLFEANFQTVSPYLKGHFNRATHQLVAEALEPEVRKLFVEEGEGGEATGEDFVGPPAPVHLADDGCPPPGAEDGDDTPRRCPAPDAGSTAQGQDDPEA
ncbi:MAG: hypothetical protein AAGM22_23780 [Acidobacteriota bacterium]